MKKLWQWFCQKMADYHFYKGMTLGWNTFDGYMELEKYHQWIDRKFGN